MKNNAVIKFKDVFEKELCLIKNNVCKECDAVYKHPLLPWVVGEQYESTKEKILFVGKPHRGITGQFPSGIIDSSKNIEWLKDSSWAYWCYTKEILSNLYGENAPWNYCCSTNIIKCTNVNQAKNDKSTDRTTLKMGECCVIKLGVIFKEIEILKPKHIIFYTHNLYPKLLNNLPFAKSEHDITPINHKIKCGKKYIGWWDRTIETEWDDRVRILVTSHPERKKKNEFIASIVNWIKKG